MKTGRFILGVSFLAMLAGCGGVAPDEVSVDESKPVEALIELPCDGSRTWEYTYYDANDNAVGGRWCDCYGHIATWGVIALPDCVEPAFAT